ncbi:MAG: hypothetical protein II592_05630 [Muribaculaceae bacterium]|nr:hypothetical protein [Muribaculaceae bacterium]
MEQQVQIQCPNCHTTLMVKNLNNTSERIINCPKCQTPIQVVFGATQAPNPPYNPQGNMPVGTPPPPAPITEPAAPAKGNGNKTLVIVLLSLLVAALAGVLIWLLLIKDKDKASSDSETSSSSVKQYEMASTSVAPEASASASVVALDDEIPEISAYASASVAPETYSRDYSLPYLGNSSYGVGEKLYNQLRTSSFVNVYNGISGSEFSSIRHMDTSNSSNQLKVENSDGYRYQFFFMGSNKNNGRLTGVAVSRACANPSSECLDFENYVAGSGNFTWVRDGLYRSSTGCYVSPGYSKGRFYVYYYLPNAPEKDPAPRN